MRRFQAGEPIVARPVGRLERGYRWCRRNPRLGASLALVVATVGVAAVWLMVAYGEVRAERDKARARLRTAKETVDQFCTDVSQSKEMKAKGTEQLRTKLLTSAVKFYERFVAEEGHDETLQIDRGRSYTRLADMYRQTGNNDLAEQAYLQAQLILKPLADAHRSEPSYHEDLKTTHLNLGILYMDTQRFEQAEEDYGKALAIQQWLAEARPGEVRYQYPLSAIYSNLGTLYDVTQNRDKAREAFENALRIFQQVEGARAELPEYDGGLVKTHINLANLYFFIGDSHRRENAPEEAEKAFTQSENALACALDLSKKLAAAHPDVPEYHSALTGVYNNLGLLYGSTGRRSLSVEYHRQALAVQQELADAHPTVLSYSIALGAGYSNLGYHVRDAGAPQDSLDLFGNAIRVLETALKKEPRSLDVRTFLRNAYLGRAQALDRLGRHAESLPDWDRAVDLDESGMGIYLRFNRAATHARAGNHARAVSDVNELAQLKDLEHTTLYHLARVCALASAAVRRDTQLSQPARDELFKRYSAQAVSLLRRAKAAGNFKNPASVGGMKRDKDIAPVLATEEFKQLLTELEPNTQSGTK